MIPETEEEFPIDVTTRFKMPELHQGTVIFTELQIQLFNFISISIGPYRLGIIDYYILYRYCYCFFFPENVQSTIMDN
jgi:hypothetical protein